MNTKIASIIATIRQLEGDLEAELAHRRLELAYTVDHGKVVFTEHVLKHHKQLRSPWLGYLLEARPLIVLTAPLIYSMVIPFALLDAFVSAYQLVCFPVYGIPVVRRRDYLIFDRSQLAYLNLFERFNCSFCSYGNGVISYVREVAGRTEQYWCPIKHSRRIVGAHDRYNAFADYGDAEAYNQELVELRKKLNSGE
jgi:hypothetical protein